MTDFDTWYSMYPKKVAKLDAIKAWRQVTREYDPAEIIDGLKRNLPTLQAKDRQYIPYPASWLRAGRWMDEPEHNGRKTHLERAMEQWTRTPQSH